MFLKRLELIGFKSFANRTELEFVPGITAVVGPNGSGKSNISDSIRWVLGEQSAKSLRGSKMEDIIFAGSDTRKPVNYCEVSLTLDNSDHTLKIDYSEVTISRRVYRSGESEYSINKRSCRLRDIIELFMDTGVGKEAYSIIGQGRIEEILSTKSEDRRGIFEEAAGIVKYKARKKEAEKKLEETEANLVRITDIISEISDQIQPLKEQAERAQHFLNLKEELKEQEVGLYIHQIDQLNQAWKEAKEQAAKLKEEHVVQSSELSALDAELSSWRWKMNEQDKELEESQLLLLHVSEEAEKTEGKREVLRERKKNVKENHQITTDKITQLEVRMQELIKQRDQEEKRKTELASEYEIIQRELRQQESLLAAVTKGLELDAEQLKADYIELLNQIASAKNDLRHVEHTGETISKKQIKLQEQKVELGQQAVQMEGKRRQLEQELREASESIESCLQAYKDSLALHKQKQTSRDELSFDLRKLEQKLESLSSRRDVLQEMQSAFTGFMQGVKEILKAREKGFSGIRGAIAELLSVPPQYETAVEVALGGALQHVVVDDESAGRKAIQWLKEHRMGRATFLPLDVIRSRRISSQDESQLRHLQGFVGVASDLVQCDARYRSIKENLLGSVIVTETLEQANQSARKMGYRFRFVTLEGDVVNPGGSMTGGMVQQKSTNLLGRNRQLEELEQEIIQVLAKKEKLADQLQDSENELRSIASKQEAIRQSGEENRLREQEVKGRCNQFKSENQNTKDRLQLVEQEFHATQEDQRVNQQKLEQLNLQLKKWSDEESELKLAITNAEVHRSKLQNSKDVHASNITDLKVKAAELRKQQEAFQSIILRVEEEHTSIHDEWKTASAYLQTLVNMMEGNLGNEEQLEKVILDLRHKKEEIASKLLLLKQSRSDTIKHTDQLESDAKLNRKQIKDVEDRLYKEELKVNRYDVELDSLLHKLHEEYSLSYELAKDSFNIPEDAKKTGEQVSELKRNIQALGVVNIGAIEEYERQSERMDFLSGQSKDLDEAKQTLYQVIKDINDEMSRRFMETFEQIRGEFQQVFTHLFVGGRADLQLSDPAQVLTTGIDIVAQPPGKKLQNLTLLSGGEKALTAIALLFAILRVKPVPFCVLDEVEAALDDANVYRFAEYLREFSGQTQFICVTHRKGTMEGADVLYGVTMQEFGVSKLVSVKLEDKAFVTEPA